MGDEAHFLEFHTTKYSLSPTGDTFFVNKKGCFGSGDAVGADLCRLQLCMWEIKHALIILG